MAKHLSKRAKTVCLLIIEGEFTEQCNACRSLASEAVGRGCLRRIVPARVLLVYGKLCVLELDVDPEKTLKQQLYELRREANRRLGVREGVFRREFVVLR